jgi:hypothetical protein
VAQTTGIFEIVCDKCDAAAHRGLGLGPCKKDST